MEEFLIKGENGNYLKLFFQEVYGYPESTSHWGGYEVRSRLEIKSGNFSVKSAMRTSTGEIYEFYKNLEAANKGLCGKVEFINYEKNLEFNIVYTELGHTTVEGTYFDFGELDNELKFEFNSDQSYLTQTIQQLKHIISKYGDMEGVI